MSEISGMDKTKLSVIMACHNAAPFLDDAVGSVLHQTLRDLELVLVDDHSSDRTLEMARSYQERDERVSVLSTGKNVGAAVARNIGMSVARGEWFGILDSDDIASPSRFEEQMKLIQREPDLVMIGSNAIISDSQRRTRRLRRYPTVHHLLIRNLRTNRPFPPHSSMIYRADAVRQLNAFNAKFTEPLLTGSEDIDLWLRLSEVGRIASVGKPLVEIRRRHRDQGLTAQDKLAAYLATAAIVCHFLRLDGHGDPSSDPDQLAWQAFLAWIEQRMEEEGAFEELAGRNDAHAAAMSDTNRFRSRLRFATFLLRSGHGHSFVRAKLFGSDLPSRLAREWTSSPARRA